MICLCAKSKPAEEQTPLGDFSDWSNAGCCSLYPLKGKQTVSYPVPPPDLPFALWWGFWGRFFGGICHYHATFLFAGIQSPYCHHPSGSRKHLWVFFIAILKLGVFMRLLNFLPLNAKSHWTGNKDVNLNSGFTGNTEQNPHVYQKMKSMMTQTSHKNFTSIDLTLTRGSASWKNCEVMEWCICSVLECGLRGRRYFSFFSFFSSVLQERRGGNMNVGFQI